MNFFWKFDDEVNERGFDDKLPEELEAAAVFKCSPHFLVTANQDFELKYSLKILKCFKTLQCNEESP